MKQKEKKIELQNKANAKESINKVILLSSVFICGACVMVLELVGSRVLAPYLGTSIVVWTSLIGVMLGAMSIGYVLGGRLADKKVNYSTYSLIILFSGAAVALVGVLRNRVISFIIAAHVASVNVAISAILSSLFLFAIPSVILAMVSPYAIKLSLASLETSGRTTGLMYSVSTLGSITGTFAAGFYLIPRFGNTAIITVISVVLIALSIVVYSQKNRGLKVLVLILTFLIGFGTKTVLRTKGAIAQYDTQYGTVTIMDVDNIRSMMINNAINSHMFLDSDELAYGYTKGYDLAMFFNPDVKKTLAIGGAGYSYPKYFLKHYEDKEIDVVEIDPKVTELARKYFRLEDNERLNIFHEDARTFLNRNETKYDAVFGDAYVVNAPPYHLVTKETMQAISNSLTDNGVFISLVVCDTSDGGRTEFLDAYYNTVSCVFEHVLLFQVDTAYVMVTALKQEPQALSSEDEYIRSLLDTAYFKAPQSTMIFTDEYSPVEFMTLKRKPR